MKKYIPFILVASAFLCPGAAFASSVVLTPYTSTSTFSPSVTMAGTLLTDTGLMNFTGLNAMGQVVFTGTLEEQVWKDATTGDLDFLYQVTNTSTATGDSILRASMTNFTGWTTAVNYITSSGSVAPTSADRSQLGDTMGFNFNIPNTIAPGTATYWMEIDTNSTTYGLGTVNLQDGGNTTIMALSPSPEPLSMALIGVGFAGLGLMRFRARGKDNPEGRNA